jgi:cytochrome P450
VADPRDVDVDRVLTVDQDVADDPYPTWRVLRETCPVFREPRFNVVVVTRYDDIVDVARRPQDFSSILAAYGPTGTDRGRVPAALCDIARRAGTPDADRPGRVQELLDSYVPDIQDQLQHVDPPLHTRHRRIVSRWFSASAVDLRADAIRRITTSLIDRFADGGRVEILDALAGPLPATVVADIIGIPEDDRDVFLDWKEEVIGNPEVEFTSATSERYQPIRELFLRFIAARRAEPGDDMITTLVTARTRDDELLDDQAVLGLLLLFLGGGQETTGKAITSGVRLLAEQPGLQADLRARPEHIPAFVEELLRFEPPVKGIFRIASRDTEIGGVAVPEGSFVQLMWGSGNRDASAFEEPDVFDAERFSDGRRPDRLILTFGHGIHLCPGAPLARLQTRIVFEELVRRFRSISLAPENDFRYFRSQILRGLAGLWVNLEPAI